MILGFFCLLFGSEVVAWKTVRLGLVQQNVGAEANGFVGPGMINDHQILKRPMGGLLIHLPKGLTVSQPTIAQGFHISGVSGVLEQHCVMVVAVVAGLILSSWIQVLQQCDGKQVKMVRTSRKQLSDMGRFGALLHQIVQDQHAWLLLANRKEACHISGQT